MLNFVKMIFLLLAIVNVVLLQTTGMAQYLSIDNPLAKYGQDTPQYHGPDALASCPVPDLKKICLERCESDLLECVIYCGNNSPCISACMRLEQECEDSCPCGKGCPDGCTGCSNSVCQCEVKETNYSWMQCMQDNDREYDRCIDNCQEDPDCTADCYRDFLTRQLECPCEENCIGGCPCNEYSCPTVNAVLVLGAFHHKPMIIDFDGNVNDDLDFEFGSDTSARSGCGVTFMNQFWYFGGSYNKVSKVVGCRLEKQADLPFSFNDGACNTFLYPTPIVLLCFDSYYGKQACHTFDGQSYVLMEPSRYSHYRTLGLANYKNQALTTGCGSGDCGSKTELFNMETQKWSDGPDYPFGRIYFYSTGQSSNAAYIIGGPYTENVVAEFKEGQWRRLGDLSGPRHSHGSITVGTKTMVVGGDFLAAGSGDTLFTEVWEFEAQNNMIISPILPHGDYTWGIGLYAVDFNFCRK